MTRRGPKPGDSYLVDLVTTTDGRLAKDVTVVVDRADLLNCGCVRLGTTRPGPADGPLASRMHLHVRRCAFHQANPPDGTPHEPLPASPDQQGAFRS